MPLSSPHPQSTSKTGKAPQRKQPASPSLHPQGTGAPSPLPSLTTKSILATEMSPGGKRSPAETLTLQPQLRSGLDPASGLLMGSLPWSGGEVPSCETCHLAGVICEQVELNEDVLSPT